MFTKQYFLWFFCFTFTALLLRAIGELGDHVWLSGFVGGAFSMFLWDKLIENK